MKNIMFFIRSLMKSKFGHLFCHYGYALLILMSGLLVTLTVLLYQDSYINWKLEGVFTLTIVLMCLAAFSAFLLIYWRLLIEKEVLKRTHELTTINRNLQQKIHERQQIEEALTQRERDFQKRHETLRYLTKFTMTEPQSSVQEVILRTAEVMEIERVSIWFYESADDIQRLTSAGLYLLSKQSFSKHLEVSSVHFPHYFAMLLKQSPVILPSPHDAILNQEFSFYLAKFQITSKLDIPIVFENKLLGVLCCEEINRHRKWMLEDRYFVQTIADIVANMIEQSARRGTEKTLLEGEEYVQLMTQKSIDGIVSIDENGKIISWNYGAEQIFGYLEKEMLEKYLQEVFPQNKIGLNSSPIAKPIELKGQHKDGHLFPVELSQTRWEREKKHFDTIIIRDITKRKETEQKLIKTLREAKAANEAKNQFLATISHELRTPLNAIIGFNQCLLTGMDGPINAKQWGSLKKIEKSSFHLLNLMNDILDWSKIEAHGMKLEIKPYNIVEIVSSCVDEIHSLAEQKNLRIHRSLVKSFILIEIDKMRIRQVLLNLLSNAIKFTDQGSITVSLFNESHQVIIKIIDTGIGLSAIEIERIFLPFNQADSSITKKYRGTGLGLIISKQIIDLHQGSISVESEKGKGSTFTITLPKKDYNFTNINCSQIILDKV